MADDMGWTDLACYGNSRVETPHLDRLAADGMRFTDAYAAAPVCSPTRAAVLTGLAPARLRITNHIPDRPSFAPEDAGFDSAATRDRLPLEQVTIAERLKGAGYATGFFGKWHLNGKSGKEGRGDAAFTPEAQGFDLNIGGCALGGPPTFFDPYRIHNLPTRRPGEYLPDRLADEVIGFVDQHHDQPFLACLWSYAVHWPMEAPEDLVAKYEKIGEGEGLKDARYAAMVEALDASIGRILSALDDRGLANDTLVVFTSDNGPYLGVAEPTPLRSGKGHLYEGGVRVPLIVRWPGVVAPGRTCDVPVISMDFHPTLLGVAGIERDDTPLDGVDLMSLFDSSGGLDRDALFFHYPNYAFHGANTLGGAIRVGDHKLIESYEDGSVELYDLGSDLGESRDLAAKRPALAKNLLGKLRKWRESVDAAMPEEIENTRSEDQRR